MMLTATGAQNMAIAKAATATDTSRQGRRSSSEFRWLFFYLSVAVTCRRETQIPQTQTQETQDTSEREKGGVGGRHPILKQTRFDISDR